MAGNAVTALQQVFQMTASTSGQKAKALQAWAHILLKPELGRVIEACQLLEQVALDTIQQGGKFSQAQGKQLVSATAACCLAVAKLQVSMGCSSAPFAMTCCC